MKSVLNADVSITWRAQLGLLILVAYLAAVAVLVTLWASGSAQVELVRTQTEAAWSRAYLKHATHSEECFVRGAGEGSPAQLAPAAPYAVEVVEAEADGSSVTRTWLRKPPTVRLSELTALARTQMATPAAGRERASGLPDGRVLADVAGAATALALIAIGFWLVCCRWMLSPLRAQVNYASALASGRLGLDLVPELSLARSGHAVNETAKLAVALQVLHESAHTARTMALSAPRPASHDEDGHV